MFTDVIPGLIDTFLQAGRGFTDFHLSPFSIQLFFGAREATDRNAIAAVNS